MPRLLHTADVHLGARHHDLGAAAVAQRERQFAAFRRSIDLAIAEHVDVVLVAGDLFDSNSQPRRSVERAAAEFARLAREGIRTVLVPGTHDVYDASSIYRIYDMPALVATAAGAEPDSLVVLTPERPRVVLPALELVVAARVFATKRAQHSPLAEMRDLLLGSPRWRVGVVHGALRIPGRVEQDDVLFTEEEIAASGLDYLALGHWHSVRRGRANDTTWAYAGAPEPVAVDQDGAGHVLLVTLAESNGQRQVSVEERRVGRTRFQRLDLDASEVPTQQALLERVRAMADPDLVLDLRITGVAPDTLELDDDELERELAPAFLRYRLRNVAVPALPEGSLPPPDTIAGAFARDLQTRIAAADAAGAHEHAAELRESLRLGRLLLQSPSGVQLA